MDREFSNRIEASDWKNSAAIVGLIRFFDYSGIPYNRDEIFSDEEMYGYEGKSNEGLDFLKFNDEDITDEKLFKFIEAYFPDDMHHCIVERKLKQDAWSEEEIKLINEKLTANTIMKKFFSKNKFDGSNKNEILDMIQDNRNEIVRETFKNKNNLYKNFCNPNVFQQDAGSTARLQGYYVDFKKKGKSISYRYNPNLYSSSDSRYYDYIPFGFTIGMESFFINDNTSVKQLYYTNNELKSEYDRIKNDSMSSFINTREVLFKNIIESAKFIDFDVEVIKKDINKDYFETLYLRQESIEILKNTGKYKVFCKSVKVGNSYINMQEKVTDSIINMRFMDEWIELLMREDIDKKNNSYFFLISSMIQVNSLIRKKIYGGGDSMNKSMNSAYAAANNIVTVLSKKGQKNKIDSYRTKLLSSLIFKDYDRFSEILLSLSNFADVNLNFAYDLFEDFEANKEVAYTFVNALNSYTQAKGEVSGENINSGK